MELIWSNDGVSTLLLPAKILLFPEEKENKSAKNVKMHKDSHSGCMIEKLMQLLYISLREGNINFSQGSTNYTSSSPKIIKLKQIPQILH